MASVMIPLGQIPTADGQGQTLYIEHNGEWIESLSHYGSESKARANMRDAIIDRLADAARAERNYQQSVLVCGNGTTLLVQYRHGTWEYAGFRGGKRGFSVSGCDSFEDGCARARKHAEDAFGGVVS